MNYAMMTYTVARQQPEGRCDMKKVIKLARDLGLKGMDQVTLYGYAPEDIRRMADDYEVKVICYTFLADLNFPDPGDRQKGIDEICTAVDTARVLGAPMVMLPVPWKTGVTREQGQHNVIAGLTEAVEKVKECGIKISVEHFPSHAPFVTSADMKKLLAAVPEIFVTFDSGNVLTGGENPCDGFMNTRDKTIHAHFKDYVYAKEGEGLPGLDGRRYRGALIGEGLLNYPELVNTMTEAEYSGYINIEYEGQDYPADQAIRKALEYLREVESRNI